MKFNDMCVKHVLAFYKTDEMNWTLSDGPSLMNKQMSTSIIEVSVCQLFQTYNTGCQHYLSMKQRLTVEALKWRFGRVSLHVNLVDT